MSDPFSPQKRSEIMSRIKGKDSKPEMFIRRLIHSLGYRYRLHQKNLPGCPDLVFGKYKKVIFINGCFWHGHVNCKKSALPTTNKEFWTEKIFGNMQRDVENYNKLELEGWSCLVIWQCEIKKSNVENLKKQIIDFLT